MLNITTFFASQFDNPDLVTSIWRSLRKLAGIFGRKANFTREISLFSDQPQMKKRLHLNDVTDLQNVLLIKFFASLLFAEPISLTAFLPCFLVCFLSAEFFASPSLKTSYRNDCRAFPTLVLTQSRWRKLPE